MNLSGVLMLEDQKTQEPPSGETDENKKKREKETGIKSHARTALAYSGRINFLFFTMIYLSLCFVALVVGCFVIYKSLSQTNQPPIRWLLLAVGITSALFIYLYYHSENHMRIFRPLIQQTVSSDLGSAEQLLRLSNSFGFSIVLLLTLASCAALYPRNTTSFPEGLKQIAVQMKYLRLILYVGTFMLVVGILLVRSIYQWSQAFLVREDQVVKIAETFFSSLLGAEGGYFTLVLAVVYLPAAFILRRRADSVDALPEPETEKEALLQEYNVAFSLTQSLPRLIAILGPLLVGPVGELFSRVV